MGRKAYEPREAQALKSYDAIKASGGDPEIWFSARNGYRVFDSTDEAVRQNKTSARAFTIAVNQLALITAGRILFLIAAAGAEAQTCFWEFFAANIRNKHTRRPYAQPAREFLGFFESAGVASIAYVQPLHIAAYIEQLMATHSAPTEKQRLAAMRHLFD